MDKLKSSYKNLVDIHCHVLPDIDDGPGDWQQSLEMSKIAYDNSISTIIATPHWIQGTSWQPTYNTVLQKIDKLNELLLSEKVNIKILSGMEVGISENLVDLLNSGEVLTLANSNYILIEIPFVSLPFGLEEIIFKLVSAGYIPLLAHPERNKELQANPGRISDLIDRGALTQITTGSFCGDWGESAMECSIEFANMDTIFTLASDGHSAGSRPPEMLEGIEVLEELIGENKVQEILSNSEKIIRKN